MVTVHGDVDDGFARVADAFAANFTQHGDVGAACAITVDGTVVVDIWGGDADRAAGRAWERDTLVITFSTTKGVTAVTLELLVAAHELGVEEAVVFVQVRDQPGDQGGVPVVRQRLDGVADHSGRGVLQFLHERGYRLGAAQLAQDLDGGALDVFLVSSRAVEKDRQHLLAADAPQREDGADLRGQVAPLQALQDLFQAFRRLERLQCPRSSRPHLDMGVLEKRYDRFASLCPFGSVHSD